MNLIEKYNVSAPRYTSYPPANYFHNINNDDYIRAVEESNNQANSLISFYLHMPFCKRLCHYCGCNSFIMPKDENSIKLYINSIHKEIDLIAKRLDKKRKISQIHFGGGSPTAMPISILKEINEHLLSLFSTIENPEIAIECHPGYLNENDWIELTNSYFNRFSLGIQDLNPKVLETVGRVPSNLALEEIMQILKNAKASVNMDFLYGLPYQTPESFAQNIQKAISLKPNRLVTFGYGHVPWVFKRQQILEKHGLPLPEEKNKMFNLASQLLHQANYQSIGLDHFVLQDDELYKALQEGLLYRNFQGYCTRRTTGQVYAFGATGISQLDNAYAQNTKDINEYCQLVGQGIVPIKKGYFLSKEERIAKEVIERLMCNYKINWEEIAKTMNTNVLNIKAALNYNENQLKEMENDGIIVLSENGLEMTQIGHPFVRNVASCLDPLMQNTDKQFSKPI